jgi:hypothetical protein
MMKPALTIAAVALLLGIGIFRVAPVQAQDEQEQTEQEPPEEEDQPDYQPAQEEVDPQKRQQELQEQDCIITGACTCSMGMCTINATGARFPAPPPGGGFVGNWYASIAKSATSTAWGASWHYQSQAAADQAALANCNQGGVTDCKVEIGDVNNCLSLAESSDGTWGVGRSGLSRADAIHVATGYCQKYGGKNCEAKVSVCGRQPTDSKPCLQVGPGIDISHWSAAALATLTPQEREAFEHPAQHTNGACK